MTLYPTEAEAWAAFRKALAKCLVDNRQGPLRGDPTATSNDVSGECREDHSMEAPDER